MIGRHRGPQGGLTPPPRPALWSTLDHLTCSINPEGRVVAYRRQEMSESPTEGNRSDVCAVYNLAGQLTAKATFDVSLDFGFMMAARRCVASPADDCQPHLWCARGEASPRFFDTCT